MYNIQGKPVYQRRAQLTIKLESGHMVDFVDWHQEAVRCQARVIVDDQVIFSDWVHGAVRIDHEFSDQQHCTHCLRIELVAIESSRANAMLRIVGVWIEGLNLRNVFENHAQCVFEHDQEAAVASEYMGQPGYQQLTFDSPIYRWLLNQDSHLKSTFYSPVLSDE